MIIEVPLASSDPFFVKLRPISLNGSNSVDPTASTSVFFSFPEPEVDPADDSWQAGTWVEYDPVSGLAVATYTLTPITLGLSKGPGIVWAKVTGGVGQPQHPVGNYLIS